MRSWEPSDPVADTALEDLASMPAALRGSFLAAIDHAAGVKTAAPSAKWKKEAKVHLRAIGEELFLARVARWFGSLDKARPAVAVTPFAVMELGPGLRDTNGDIVRGLSWTASLASDERSAARVVGDLGALAFKRVPGVGAIAPKVGNACVVALGAMEGIAGVAQIGRLKAKVQSTTALRMIDKALRAAAERAGMSADDLEEIAVPTCGLDDRGQFEAPLGEWTAMGRLLDGGTLDVRFRSAAGEETAKAPKGLKGESAELLRELKARVKEVAALYPAQVARLDALLGGARTWRFEEVFERYLIHGLVGPLARRLIWSVEGVPAVWRGSELVAIEERVAVAPQPGSPVTLWHPLGREDGEVRAIRRAIVESKITQPVKQAFREVIVPTDAESRSSPVPTGHIVRQHQLSSALRARNWKVTLAGTFDSGACVTRTYPDDWTATMDVRVPWNPMEISDAGTALYVETCDVQFYRGGSPARLGEVPPLLFSEAVRELENAVVASSILVDPAWATEGHPIGRRHFDRFAFADELGPSGLVRKRALELLVAASGRRDLVVSGSLLLVAGTFEIHIGTGQARERASGRLLVFPPTRARGAARIFSVPFEGDPILNAIVTRAHALAS